MSPQKALTLAELPDVGAVRVVLDGVAVAVVRDEAGDVHAIGDTCSHAEVSLAEGEVVDCTIECWLHGSTFDLRTGEPLALPAIRPIPIFPVTIDGEHVLVDVAASTTGPVTAPVTSEES